MWRPGPTWSVIAAKLPSVRLPTVNPFKGEAFPCWTHQLSPKTLLLNTVQSVNWFVLTPPFSSKLPLASGDGFPLGFLFADRDSSGTPWDRSGALRSAGRRPPTNSEGESEPGSYAPWCRWIRAGGAGGPVGGSPACSQAVRARSVVSENSAIF